MKIRTKIVSILVASSIAAIAALGGFIERDQNARGEARLAADIERIAARLEYNLVTPLWNFDDTAFEAVVSAEASSPSILAIIVREPRRVRNAFRNGSAIELSEGELSVLAGLSPGKTGAVVRDSNELAKIEVYVSRVELETERRNSVYGLIIQMALLSIVIALVSFFIVQRTVDRPLNRVVQKVRELSSGDADLTRSIHTLVKDEIGKLADSMNAFIEKLRNIVSGAKTTTRKVHEIQISLGSNATETAAALTQITANIQSIGDRMESLDAESTGAGVRLTELDASISGLRSAILREHGTIKATATAVTAIERSLATVSDNSRESMESLDQLRASARIGGEKLAETTVSVEMIRQSVDTIADFIGIINAIASQTNLLAMNAAIEAAHAGNAGKGFSVVADEIRKLAESSSEQAKRVSETIRKIVDEIVAASGFTLATDTAFREIDLRITGLVQSLGGVESAVSDFKHRGADISLAVKELESGAVFVEKTADQIDIIRRATITAVVQVQNMSSEVANGMMEIKTGTQEINVAMNELKDRVNELSDVTAELDDTMGQFKT